MIVRTGISGTPGIPADINGWALGGSFARVSDNTFTVANTTANQNAFVPGRPLRYRSAAGSWRYGIVVSYVAGLITIAGAKMTTADDDVLEWSAVARIVPKEIIIPGRWADAASTKLLEEDLNIPGGLRWTGSPAYLVRIAAIDSYDDTGANQPRVNVTINGNPVCTSNTNAGIEVIQTGYTDSASNINTDNYAIDFEEAFEVITDANGSNNDSTNLTLELIFILA